MWDAPLGLDFGLDLWRLHTIVVSCTSREAVRLEGLFGQGIVWDAPFSLEFGLWRLHIIVVQVETP